MRTHKFAPFIVDIGERHDTQAPCPLAISFPLTRYLSSLCVVEIGCLSILGDLEFFLALCLTYVLLLDWQMFATIYLQYVQNE